jgi:hypothetical protein
MKSLIKLLIAALIANATWRIGNPEEIFPR